MLLHVITQQKHSCTNKPKPVVIQNKHKNYYGRASLPCMMSRLATNMAYSYSFIIIIIIIITDEYDLGGTVALLLQDHLTLLIVSCGGPERANQLMMQKYKAKADENKRSKQFDKKRPQRCRTWTVQSYLPDGANVQHHLICASLHPPKSTSQKASR